MVGASYLLFQKSNELIGKSTQRALRETTLAEKARRDHPDAQAGDIFRQNGSAGRSLGSGVGEFDVTILVEPFKGREAHVYKVEEVSLLAPLPLEQPAGDLKGLFLVVTALVILTGGGAAALVAMQVSKPLNILVDDVRTIARGNLRYKTRVSTSGEVGHLARSIDRMAAELDEAQDAQVELGVREREKDVARDVSAALLPKSTPEVHGVTIADAHESGIEIGGGFHEYVTAGDRCIAIVCEVTGEGIPAALIGATARAYMRSEFERADSILEALSRVNAKLSRDLRPGLAVSMVCASVESGATSIEICSAGHKLPIVHYNAAEGKAVKLHPEGFALGFEAGPAFARTLEVLCIPFGPGDRMLFASEGAAQVLDADESELGEAGWLRAAARSVRARPEKTAQAVVAALQEHAGAEPFPSDVSCIVITRNA
jgi:phosphoserine phosphatase RsbU/P